MPTCNAAGLALIAEFEGCRLRAYNDGTGVQTIGYGHTRGVSAGQTITQAQALEWLRADVKVAETEVAAVVQVQLTPNQFAALVSFEFNTGALRDSRVLALLNADDFVGAMVHVRRYVNAGGAPVQGLVRRRAAECALFFRP